MNDKQNPDLTGKQINVCFRKRTEPAGSGKWLHTKEAGAYHCVNCNQKLFVSDTKFDSGTGWPSFWDATESNVKIQEDTSMGAVRTEVLCSNCDAHLGHVFNDGPKPTGQRYCINSLALDFKSKN